MKLWLTIPILTFSTSFEGNKFAQQVCVVVQTILVLLQRFPTTGVVAVTTAEPSQVNQVQNRAFANGSRCVAGLSARGELERKPLILKGQLY